MKIGKILKYILSLILAAVMLYFSFRGIQWEDFIAGARACNWSFIALAMLSSVLAFFFRSERWRILLKPFDNTLDPLSTFNGVNIGYLANFAFPRIGEVIRCGFISRRSLSRHGGDSSKSASFENVLGTVLLSRTWDMMMVFILIIVLLSARWAKFGEFFADDLFGRVLDGMNMHMAWVLCIALVLLSAALWLMYILRHRIGILRKAGDFLHGMAAGFKSCIHMEGKAAFFFHTAMLWLMYWLMSMSIIWAMPQLCGLDWVDALFLCLAGSVAWMIPVPGGFGAYHGVIALALTVVYGYTQDTGLLYATLNHEAQAITMIVCGILSYFCEIIRK